MNEVTAVPIRPVKKGAVTKLWLAIGAAVLGAGAVAWAGTSKPVAMAGTNEQFLAWNAHQLGVKTTPSGLQIQTLKTGKGLAPTDADVAIVNYKGAMRDGSVFDETQRPTPLPVARMIPGFAEGLKLMSKGGKYRLWIPAALGYGDRSPDPSKLPQNSLLVFDVELVDFMNQEQFMAQMMQQQMQQGGQPQR